MDEMEKLRVLLAHWMEHNTGHEAECSQWAKSARDQGEEKVAEYIEAAVAAMHEVNRQLQLALDQAGGPAAGEHHHHH